MTTCRILVASADASIRKLMASKLVQVGYQVIEARTGEAARTAILDSRMGIMLAILDGQMPPVSANGVVAEIRAASCQVPVILTSGSFLADKLPTRDERVAFLAKPFDLDDLIQCVESLLGGR